jgi:hypothetical protein
MLEIFFDLLWIGWGKDTIWMSMCKSEGPCLWNALFVSPLKIWYPNWERIAIGFRIWSEVEKNISCTKNHV